VRLLDDRSLTKSGVFLYYAGRRQVPATLQAFVSFVRRRLNGNAKRLGSEQVDGRATPLDNAAGPIGNAKADGHAVAG
jgi:hypothetical protein